MKMSREVKVGNRVLGGDNPVLIQSMISVPSTDIEGSVSQAVRLEKAGCEILRAAIPDEKAVELIPAIKDKIGIPLVADIHFDYRLALMAAEAGIDKIRINPGNIGDDDRVRQVVEACGERGISIRVGVNSGSLQKDILEKYGSPTPEALCESAMRHVGLLEKFGFYDTVISIKSSTVKNMIEATRLVSQRCDYPLHIGVTEAGTERMGIIKNAIGIGSLLIDGIGSTVRVSLTADPEKEIEAAKDILKACGVRKFGPNIVSCPTCGRTRISLIDLASKVENALSGCDKEITVAVMGCIVNGPGEAREADIGVAGGEGCGLIFKKGEILRKVPEDEIVEALLEEINRL